MDDKTIAERIEAELQTLTVKGGGILKCEAIVEFARNKKSAMHSRFTWDDSAAAHEHRLWQARQLVKQYYIPIQAADKTVRIAKWVSVPSDRVAGGGYRFTTEVRNNPDMRAEVEREALAKLKRVADEYQAIRALDPIREAIEKRQMELGFGAAAAAVAV
jgi:hypothetical protein